MISIKQAISSLIYASGLVLSVHSVTVFAEESNQQEDKPSLNTTTLPSPLNLTILLNDYAQKSPQINLQQANIDYAKAVLGENQVENSWQANIAGRLGQREFAEQQQDHNQLALHVGKVLYDFNRADSRYSADESTVEQQLIRLQDVQNQQRLSIVKAYFNVLLADFQYRIDNEGMAVEYVGFDKVKDKHAVGRLSDVDLLKAEQTYQASLVKRMQAEQMQLQTRIELANVLGLPSARPDELTFPKLKAFKKRSIKGIDLETLQNQVIEKNTEMQAFAKAKQALLFELENASKTSSPTLRADAWVGQLSSQPEVREGTWKAELTMDIPLYDGGASSLAINKAQASLSIMKAKQQQLEQSLRSQVSQIYFQLKLIQAEKKQHQAFGDYADLYLDLSRALYENESSTDLGDSMVRLSEANYQMVAWQFKQALLWLELDYLLGQTINLDNTNTALLAGPVKAK